MAEIGADIPKHVASSIENGDQPVNGARLRDCASIPVYADFSVKAHPPNCATGELGQAPAGNH